MRKFDLWYLLIGTTIGLIAGFWAANAFYRSQAGQIPTAQTVAPINANQAVTTAAAQPQSSQTTAAVEKLSDDELRRAIAKVEQNPNDLKQHRDLGLNLYRYAALEQKVELLPDVIRLLERAQTAPEFADQTLLTTLGDAYFNLAREKDSAQMPKARAAYQKALKIKPNDADLLTDIGLTFYFARPSDTAAALDYFEQSLKINPRHERALENLITLQINAAKIAQAQENLIKLKQINRQNVLIADLETQLAQKSLESGK